MARSSVEFHYSRNFPSWLSELGFAIAFSAYHVGKLFLVGADPHRSIAICERTFNRCMGLFSADSQTIWMGTKYQIWRFEDALQGTLHESYDRLYVPRAGYTTSDLDVHDIAEEGNGRIVFANTRFNCLATLAERDSFAPVWQPPFINDLVSEDRCHLNGLALEDEHVRYVTAVSTSDVIDGWRERCRDGGVVMDVTSNQIVADRLSMPHSPRVYRGKLWLLNSGTGYLGSIDRARGTFEPLAFCPGYLRGLAFFADYAIVGLSKPRHNKTFGGLALSESLTSKGLQPQCGLHVIDLRSGDCVEWMRIDGDVEELYDVAVLPGVRNPMVLGFETDEIERTCSIGTEGDIGWAIRRGASR
ncbi:MAG TPA: TIGR03032 family protein [Humisphaera sp.]|nr:TIGR03032 family protein [Humisphaera sp.]